MKEINAIRTKKQRYFGRNTRTQMSRTALLKVRVNWKYCKRLKYSAQKRESYCFLGVNYKLFSVQDPEFRVIIMGIKVAEINVPLK